MYIYIYVCIYVYINIYICIYIYLQLFIYLFIYIYLCLIIHVCIPIYTYIYIYVCMYMYIYIYMHTYMHACIYVYRVNPCSLCMPDCVRYVYLCRRIFVELFSSPCGSQCIIPLLTAKYLEKKTRRFFEFIRPRSFSVSWVHPRFTRRWIKTSRPNKKIRVYQDV